MEQRPLQLPRGPNEAAEIDDDDGTGWLTRWEAEPVSLEGVYDSRTWRRLPLALLGGAAFCALHAAIGLLFGLALPPVVDLLATAAAVFMFWGAFESHRANRNAMRSPELAERLIALGRVTEAEKLVTRAGRGFGLTLAARAYVAWARILCLAQRGAWERCERMAEGLVEADLVSILPPAVSQDGGFEQLLAASVTSLKGSRLHKGSREDPN